MSDETPAIAEQPLPERVPIPAQAVREWVKLPEDEPLNIELSRREVDHLFFAINKTILGQDALAAALLHYVNGSTTEAHAQMHAHQRELVEAQNRLRQFMTNVMLSATRRDG
jgi:hypothetical protein